MACKHCEPYGGRWRIVERNGREYAAPCECTAPAAAPGPHEPLDLEEVATVVSDLAALNFFPTGDEGRLAVCKLVSQMATTIDQAVRLVDQMLLLYNDWPGPRELRVVFCSRVGRPVDGVEVFYSSVYPEGCLPDTRPAPVSPLLLPAGDPLRARVVEVGQARALPALPAPGKSGDEGVQELRKELQKHRPAPSCQWPAPADFVPITQADIDRELEARALRRARAEADGLSTPPTVQAAGDDALAS